MKVYKLTRDRLYNSDVGNYISYGIEIFENERLIKAYNDLSLNKASVEDLCEILNRLQVRFDEEIIEDFLER